jgi:LuxR family transcriptional regulator, maltose regulon positive regulatory protein
MHAQAPLLLQQGRGRVLEGWLRALPMDFRAGFAWTLYWLGRCRLGYAPAEARGLLEQAFGLFENEDEPAGMFTAWASIVDTYVYEWGEFASLDRWIEVLDRLLDRSVPLPTPEIEARVASGMFTALMYRQPHRTDLPEWAERVRSIAVGSSDGRTQMLLGNQLMHYYTSWAGDVVAARLLLDAVRLPADAAEYGPLAYLAACAMQADYYWHVGAHEACRRCVEEGRETVRRTGARFASSRLEAHGAMGYLLSGDFKAVDNLLKRAAGGLSGSRLVYRAHYHYLAFLSAFYQGDASRASSNAREAVALADAAGVPLCQAVYRLGLAHAHYRAGEVREALRHLGAARRLARRMRIATTELSCVSTTTYLLLERGRLKRALPWLRRTLERAKARGQVNRVYWTGAIMSRLFATALEQGIEVAYVQELIRRHRLAPGPDASDLEQWPFPVKVRTLGRFGVTIDGKPLQFSGKAQRKPLELLMALVAFGGCDVSERQLTEALWPDAEGDAAHQSCAVTLHRLRKLLGCDEAITLQGSHFSLDPRYVWLDVWAFERALGSTPDRARAIYRGPFLATHLDLPWAIPLREQLRTRFVRHLGEQGRRLFAAGEFEAAVALFEEGLGADPMAEELYCGLMQCYQALDRRAEAIGVYQRCRQTLAAGLGVEPAPKTDALYRALRSDQVQHPR